MKNLSKELRLKSFLSAIAIQDDIEQIKAKALAENSCPPTDRVYSPHLEEIPTIEVEIPRIMHLKQYKVDQ